MTHYAAVRSDKSGPAFGIGHSPAEALEDAAKWCDFPSELVTVEITPDSFARVQAGNPDVWEEAEMPLNPLNFMKNAYMLIVPNHLKPQAKTAITRLMVSPCMFNLAAGGSPSRVSTDAETRWCFATRLGEWAKRPSLKGCRLVTYTLGRPITEEQMAAAARL